MQIDKINNIKSEEFNKIIELGDRNAKTLGFLPYVAFEKYATQNQLIGAFDKANHDLLGYLLYRTSYNKVTIIHLCIDENHRNKKVSKNLINFLKKNTKNYQGIRLSCRNDYGINKVWESFNFVPIKEKQGRSKAGLPLTIWWFPHNHNDLFSQFSDFELKNKIIAVIDMNIFLDIKNDRNKESVALKSDWLLSEATLCLTREIYNEINRNSDKIIKESSRRLASQFNELPFKNEAEFSSILNELESKFILNDENDNSDIRHIAYSISGGAEFFITRDENIIQNRDFFYEYGLTIYRPSEFITHLDENIQTSKYKPQRLIGTNINTERISNSNVDFIISKFLTPKEKKSKLKEKVRNYLSLPHNFELLTIYKNNDILAFVVFDRTKNGILQIPIFRFLKSSIRNTLAKHFLYRAILTSTKEDRIYTEISEEFLDEELINIIKETKFVLLDNCWKKLNIKGVCKQCEISSQINKFVEDKENINNLLKIFSLNNNNESSKFESLYNTERYLTPLKIEDFEIPTFIIPIKPHWAETLFDDKSERKLALFEPDYKLLLNRENVYYRSATPKIIQAPARILWYLSEDKSTKEKGKISATSYIDEIFIDSPKILFKRFEQLGVYKWEQIANTVGKNKEIMAFVFSDTELFTNTLSNKIVKEVFESLENKNFMPISPVRIKKETYIELYKLGMEL